MTAMIRAARQEAIVGLLDEHVSMPTRELAERLDASVATVRRDLTQLAEQGRIQRDHGGAVALGDRDQPFGQVLDARRGAKQRIAERAAAMVRPGSVVALDVGTTAFLLAQRLAHVPCTVVTSSVAAMQALADSPGAEVLLLGGRWDRTYSCTQGPITEKALQDIEVDIAFLGCSGVSTAGYLRDTTELQVPVKRGLAGAAPQRVLLADASKFPGRGELRVLPLGELESVVTDAEPPAWMRELAAGSGTEIVVAADPES